MQVDVLPFKEEAIIEHDPEIPSSSLNQSSFKKN